MSRGGVVDHGVGETDALAIAFGQCAVEATPNVGDFAAFQAVVDPRGALATLDALEFGPISQIFLDAHFGIKRNAFRQIADSLAHLHGLHHHIESGHAGDATGSGQIRRQHPHDRRFAGTVVAE